MKLTPSLGKYIKSTKPRDRKLITMHRAKTYRATLEEQFAKVGEAANTLLVKESQARFVSHCTGRANCIGAQFTLKVSQQTMLHNTRT